METNKDWPVAFIKPDRQRHCWVMGELGAHGAELKGMTDNLTFYAVRQRLLELFDGKLTVKPDHSTDWR